jgi:hypothetical protein
VVPVEFMDLRALAEIWVDPNPEQPEDENRGGKDASHMLMVFDVEGVGQLESELYVRDKRIAMSLLCPPRHAAAFAGLGPFIRRAVAPTGYTFEVIHIGELERVHSLMDVFPGLSHRRMGMDVKI